MRAPIAVFCCCLALVAGGSWGEEPMVIFDFAGEAEAWPSIDDGVMGGLSSSAMVIEGGIASFRGEVSFANNGGFASLRSRPQPRDLSACAGLVLRVRGDGRRYGLRLRTDAAFDGVSYQAELHPPAGEWVEVALPFTAFEPVFRGRRVADHPPLDPSRITTFGLIIARQEGQFRLDVANISGFRLQRNGGGAS